MTQRSDLRVVKNTGTVLREDPRSSGITATASAGTVLRNAQPAGGYWRVADGRYVAQSDVVAISDVPAQPLPRYIPMSQRDPRWGSVLLGNTTDQTITIHDYGCLLVCFTMLVDTVLQPPVLPAAHNDFRKATGAFASPGPWGGLATSFDVRKDTRGRVAMTWVSDRFATRDADPETLRRLVDHLSQNAPAILEVDFYPDDGADPRFRPLPGKQMHFVLATRVEVGGPGEPRIIVIDPFDGQEKPLNPRFGGTLARAVVRVVLYDVDTEAPSLPLPAPNEAPAAPRAQPAPPTVQNTTPVLGVNVLWHGRIAMDAFNRGCRWFTVVDNLDSARDLARRGAVVGVRHVWSNWMPTVEQYLNFMGELIPGACYIGVNENDSIGDDAENIAKRAAFDVAVARAIRARSKGLSTYASGTFAMGSPDLNSPAVCKAIRDGYAAAYNEGIMLFDLHSYVSQINGDFSLRGDGGRRWFARRWELLFQRCGFDPAVRAIVSSETGLDNGAGFIKNRVSNEDFTTFCQDWLDLQGRPLVIDNRSDELVRAGKISPSPFEGTWKSPYLGGTLFHLAPPEEPAWRDHNLYLYFNELRQVWQRLAALPASELPTLQRQTAATAATSASHA